MIKWLKVLLSDSSQASLRRFIGLQSFYLLVFIVFYLVLKNQKLQNQSVIQSIVDYLFIIVMVTLVGVTITDTIRILKSRLLHFTNQDSVEETTTTTINQEE